MAPSEWLVIVKDKPGKLAARMAVRPQHLANAQTLAQKGVFTLGGATLSSPPQEGQPLAIDGSALLTVAESREDVVELLRKDVYAEEVWDIENAQIIPFKSAVRSAL